MRPVGPFAKLSNEIQQMKSEALARLAKLVDSPFGPPQEKIDIAEMLQCMHDLECRVEILKDQADAKNDLRAELELMTKHANEGWALANTRTAELREKDLQVHELQDIVRLCVEQGGLSFHVEGGRCPEDDTCDCPDALRVNAAMKGYTEKRKSEGCVDDQHRGTECKCCHMIAHCCSHHCCCFYRCKDCRHAEFEHEKGPCGFSGTCNCKAYNGERR